jgi:hypothetical protein
MSNGQGLTYLEAAVARSERRIKSIKENPDPTKPKSNILLYEMERDNALEAINEIKQGKRRPYGALLALGLTRALGMRGWGAITAADRSAGPMADMYFKIIREQGMAEHTCDRTIVLVPMVLRGDYPKPDFVMVTNWECMPIYLSYLIVAHVLDIPYFVIDRKYTPYRTLEDEAQLKYVTDQLEEMIEYIEVKVPGCKYDEEKLIETQYYLREYLKYEQQQWKLRAAIPCPIAPKEAFRELLLNGSPKGVEYARMYTEELAEKVARGESGLPQGVEEKLRFLWSNTGPFHHDPFTWLGTKGVSIPASLMTVYEGWRSGREPIWGDPWHGRKLTSLEEEARQLDYVWGRLGERWVENHLNVCRDLKMDGIVYFVQWGCTVTNNLGKVVADVAERELGIPTLLIEGRQLDSTSWDEKDFLGRLEEFIEIALEAKKSRALRRQQYGS